MPKNHAKSNIKNLADALKDHNQKRFECIRSNDSADEHLVEAFNTCASSEIDLNRVEFDVSDAELGLDPPE